MLSWSQRGTLFARFCVAMSLVTLTVTGVAQAACDAAVGRFISIEGSVSVQSVEGGRWQDAKLSRHLCEGDSIRVGERSRAAVALINDAVVRIDQNTAMRLLDINKEKSERSWLDLLRGAFQSFSRKPTFLTVNTPYLNGSIEGTEFTMRVEDGATAITVFEGVVVASNDLGEVETVAVKDAITRYAARSFHPTTACATIRAAAATAVERALDGAFAPFHPDGPLALEITFVNAGAADAAELVPGTERVDGVTCGYVAPDAATLLQVIQAWTILAGSTVV